MRTSILRCPTCESVVTSSVFVDKEITEKYIMMIFIRLYIFSLDYIK